MYQRDFFMTSWFFQVIWSDKKKNNLFFLYSTLEKKLEQGVCPFKCFIKQDECLLYTTSKITTMALVMGEDSSLPEHT